jgi:hypothetical protein
MNHNINSEAKFQEFLTTSQGIALRENPELLEEVQQCVNKLKDISFTRKIALTNDNTGPRVNTQPIRPVGNYIPAPARAPGPAPPPGPARAPALALPRPPSPPAPSPSPAPAPPTILEQSTSLPPELTCEQLYDVWNIATTKDLTSLRNNPMRVQSGRNKVADIEKMSPCIQELEDKVKALPTETVMNVLRRLKITNKQSFDRIITNTDITRHQKRMIKRYYYDALRRGSEVQNRNRQSDVQSQINNLYQNPPPPSDLNKVACDELMARYSITTSEEALEMFSSDRITDTQLAQILECIRTRNALGSVAARAAAINASKNTQVPLPGSRSASPTNVANYGNQRATNLEQGRNPTRPPDAKSGKGRRTRRNRRK